MLHNTRISLIAAMDENRVIGKDNKVPWHIREDLIHLKNLVKGNVVILGRKTFDSLSWYYDRSGRPMPGRLYIIVTHNVDYKPSRDNTLVVHSVDDALSKAAAEGESEVFVIGGQKIFEQTIEKADKLYLTIIKTKTEGDAYFPDYSMFTKVVNKEEHQEDGYTFTFLDLEK